MIFICVHLNQRHLPERHTMTLNESKDCINSTWYESIRDMIILGKTFIEQIPFSLQNVFNHTLRMD